MDIGLSIVADTYAKPKVPCMIYISDLLEGNFKDKAYNVIDNYWILCQALKTEPGLERFAAIPRPRFVEHRRLRNLDNTFTDYYGVYTCGFKIDFEEYDAFIAATDEEAKRTIARKVDRVLLSQYSGESQNFKSLMELVNSNKVISVILDDKFSFKGKNGQLGTAHMSYFPFDESFPEDKDLNFEFISSLSTGESGFYGKTLFPDNEGEQNSTTDAIEVIIHPSLSKIGAAEAFSHEGYGHALLYVRNGGDHHGASHITKGMTETNVILKSMILKARKETYNNLMK